MLGMPAVCMTVYMKRDTKRVNMMWAFGSPSSSFRNTFTKSILPHLLPPDKQPCTTSIYYESSGHCKVLSRELQAVWLDEALTLRIPKVVPVGKKYNLVPVTIKTGGLVQADLSKKTEKVTYHDNVVIGPANRITKYKVMNFWVPGPKTAALYVEWVEKNGGAIKMNKADEIAEPLSAKK